jgi:hypothetical protein
MKKHINALLALSIICFLSLNEVQAQPLNEVGLGLIYGKIADDENLENKLATTAILISWLDRATVDSNKVLPIYSKYYLSIPLEEQGAPFVSITIGYDLITNEPSSFYTGLSLETGIIVFLESEGIFKDNFGGLQGTFDYYLGFHDLKVHLIGQLFTVDNFNGMGGIMISYPL